MSVGRVLRSAVLLAVAGLATSRSPAATPLVELQCSSDVTVTLASTTLDDEDLGVDNLAGGVGVQGVGAIPHQADVDAYNVRPNGDRLLSFDTTVDLPGGLTAEPGDVVRYDGGTYALEFDASANGVPNGVNVDAVAAYGSALVLSFDVGVTLSGINFGDEDLALFTGSAFSMFFDGSAAGISPELDLDAVDTLECNDHLLVSFDGSGTVGGVTFDDEDVLEFDRVSVWSMAYDGSAQHAAWSPADLDAVHATVDLGPGPAAVFGETIQFDADKATIRWPTPVAFKSVRGAFVSASNIGAYLEDVVWTATGATVVDGTAPGAGSGFWYLVRRWGCFQTSWQSTLGQEPSRDLALP